MYTARGIERLTTGARGSDVDILRGQNNIVVVFILDYSIIYSVTCAPVIVAQSFPR